MVNSHLSDINVINSAPLEVIHQAFFQISDKPYGGSMVQVLQSNNSGVCQKPGKRQSWGLFTKVVYVHHLGVTDQ